MSLAAALIASWQKQMVPIALSGALLNLMTRCNPKKARIDEPLSVTLRIAKAFGAGRTDEVRAFIVERESGQ